MILLTVEEIINLHNKMIKTTGGSYDVRDIGLLESAVHGVLANYFDKEIYPTLEEKSARLAFALIKNHAFVDGNKWIGILVMLMTLRLNKIEIKFSQKELINLGLKVADGSFDYEKILNWISVHKN